MSNGAHPKDKNGNYLVPSRVPLSLLNEESEQRAKDALAKRAKVNIAERDAEELRRQKAERTAPQSVPIVNNSTSTILKSDLLKGEENLNLLGTGAFSLLKMGIKKL